MDLGLKGKKVILTGGSRGLGRAALERFAEEGADIAFFSRNAEQVAEAAESLGKHGGKVFAEASVCVVAADCVAVEYAKAEEHDVDRDEREGNVGLFDEIVGPVDLLGAFLGALRAVEPHRCAVHARWADHAVAALALHPGFAVGVAVTSL